MSFRFLLDTNICIYIAKRHPPEVARRFEGLRPGDVGMSIITYGELLFGAEKGQHPQPAKERLQRFVELVPVLPLPDDSPRHYARIRHQGVEPIRANELVHVGGWSRTLRFRPGRNPLPVGECACGKVRTTGVDHTAARRMFAG